MRRSLLALAAAIAGIGLFAGGLAWLLNPPRPPAGAARGERLYYAYCADCHGVDGRGSWRALLFLRRPGDLADPDRVRTYTDEYLVTIIKHGGDVLGRPGMPAFRHLPDEDIQALVEFIRTLPARRPMAGPGDAAPASRAARTGSGPFTAASRPRRAPRRRPAVSPPSAPDHRGRGWRRRAPGAPR